MFVLNTTLASLLGDYTDRFGWFPDAASTFSDDIDWLYFGISWLCIAFFIPIAFCLFYFGWKYRKPKGQAAESNVAHNTKLELAWSIFPSFFLVAMFVFGARSFLDLRMVPDGANELEVQAFKWGWTVHYGRGTYHPELHLLLDQPVKLSMTSSDVIHSLFVPAFRAKKDIVPGRYNYMWFKPTVASERVSEEELAKATEETKASGGTWDYDKHQFTPDGYTFFDLYCAEYCGTDHSQMQTVVVVHESLEDLNAWIKKYSQRTDQSPEEYGKQLYQNRGCKGCHSLDGSRRTGPSFVEVFGNTRNFASGQSLVADENYIRESILNPKAKIVAGYQPAMPSFKGQFSEDDLYSLVEFLKSVSEHTPEEPAAEDTAADADAEGEADQPTETDETTEDN